MKRVLLLLVVIGSTIILSSCSGLDFFDNDFDVEFVTNGGTEIESIELELESQIEIPITPTKEGYIFSGWYYDENFTMWFDESSLIYGDTILYAKWAYDGIVEPDDPIDLDSLPYSNYLDETNPVITIVIQDIGTMTLELFPSVAPNTVNNFITYIQNGDFSNNLFHRVIEGFMIQGGNTNSTECPINGDFLSNGFVNDLSHNRGVISMARTNVMNSATSQFFIVHEDSIFLDGNYATFGGLIDGFNVLDYIAGVDTNTYDKPLGDVVIESISVDLNGYEATSYICAY